MKKMLRKFKITIDGKT
ncbi:hypothetical protein Lpl14_09860, partial [Lacticaseibacillus paracasei subsp. tolerans Lpl14]